MLFLKTSRICFSQLICAQDTKARVCLFWKILNMTPTRVSSRRYSRPAPLLVKSVDLLKQETGVKHYTSDYESDELVVRRGFPFKLMLTLSRELKPEERVEFELRMGGRPMVHHGSLIRLPKIDSKPGDDVDGYSLLASVGDILTIEVHTSAKSTGVGQWLLVMKPFHGRRKLPVVQVTDDIIVIFNPWSRFDPVYMSNDKWRQEYVLNENGMQFYGTSYRIGGGDWYFGQFESAVMKASLKLLHMGDLRYNEFKDPVMISRHLSGLVNSNDDNGVLVGNWSGDYEGGRSPTDWNGSAAILKQFVDTGLPVKYGQCWVFSGVLTAVLRCLGIPSRSVTTFASAHDTDGNITIDYHYDENGKPMDNDDSVWNFHVWNDAWMAREDLPDGYGGWQAVDATPQETSEGKFQCGPGSVTALKEGQINLDYDCPFIYAEVNGTKKHWMRLKKPRTSEDGKLIEWEEIDSDTDVIGKHISTKAVGEFKREDLTIKYKYAEGTPEEELSFHHARKYVKFTKVARKEITKVIQFQPHAPGAVTFGQDVSFKIRFTNITKKPHSIFLSVVAKTMQYNGSVVASIYDKDFRKDIPASKSGEVEVNLPIKTYLESIKGNNSIRFFFLGGVEGTNQMFTSQAIVDFDKPTIEVQAVPPIKLLRPVKVKAMFNNPLPVALTGGVFRFEGAGLKDLVVVPADPVKAHGVCKVEATIVPRKLGSRRIIVGFSSKQLQDVRGAIDIQVV